MKKIPSLFQRDLFGDRLVRNEITPGTEWVVAGEGIATKKLNGMACLFRDGKLYKRYDAKHGKKPPSNFEPASEPDAITGHWPGWVPVGNESNDKWHREAFEANEFYDSVYSLKSDKAPPDGTYELCGPKIQGNPEKLSFHVFFRHGGCELCEVPRNFEGIKEYLRVSNEKCYLEGIVWHCPDGRMAKIKHKDFFPNEIQKTESPDDVDSGQARPGHRQGGSAGDSDSH